jgi:hypothetical protein
MVTVAEIVARFTGCRSFLTLTMVALDEIETSEQRHRHRSIRQVGARLSSGLRILAILGYSQCATNRMFMHRCRQGERPHLPPTGSLDCRDAGTFVCRVPLEY